MKFVISLTDVLIALAVASAIVAASAQSAAPDSADETRFFEERIRPLLADHCFACHGPQKQKSGLRLDSAEAVRKGSETGPVVTAGKPEQSPLIRAVDYDGDIKMPPKGKLPAADVEALARWVKMGAIWPETTARASAPSGAASVAAQRTHWAFQPVRKPTIPAAKNHRWPTTAIDQFILAKLEFAGLLPSAVADKRTLLRRATIDLIGLPPTPADVAAFEADTSPDAFARVVDRLLASPHYGERWGRHWLDVARYADTKGYVFQEERRFPYSYTYRDYVIRAFNDDLPVNEFIMQQLAADQLALGADQRPLAAMGFLTLGRRFLNNPHDIIDDRIDVVTRGLLGITVTCARCHDHKYDPVPSKDYYSLYGVFASSVEPNDLPLIGQPDDSAEYQAFEKELREREKAVNVFLESKRDELQGRLRTQTVDYWLASRHPDRPRRQGAGAAQEPGELNPIIVQRWRAFLNENGTAQHPVLGPWHEFSVLPPRDFADKAKVLIRKYSTNDSASLKINPLIAQALVGIRPQSLNDIAECYRAVLSAIDQKWRQSQKQSRGLADPHEESVRQLLYGSNSPSTIAPNDTEMRRLLDRAARNRLAELRRKVDQWRVSSPAAPPRAMILRDAPIPQNPRVLLRGNPNSPGDTVPRQFLEVVAGANRKPFQHGSGRLELARAIIAPDNPLTARVFVNRVWLHHFGTGLVRTPSDFGLRGDAPSHPELLDYLAAVFMDEGWSIKRLHRTIMLSSVYQQKSDDDAAARNVDPDNRYYWRMNRQRLDFEALRDALLVAAGNIDRRMGGAAVPLTTTPFVTRRSIYGFIDRQNLPGMFRTFDFASPDATSPQRHHTTVPQQALFLMNSPFVVQQARHVLERPEVTTCPTAAAKVERLYQLFYGRAPESEELALALNYLSVAPGAAETWHKYVQVLLLANEFAFVD